MARTRPYLFALVHVALLHASSSLVFTQGGLSPLRMVLEKGVKRPLSGPPRRTGLSRSQPDNAGRSGGGTAIGGKYEALPNGECISSGKSRVLDGRFLLESGRAPLKLKVVQNAHSATAEREIANMAQIKRINGGRTRRSFVELVDAVRDSRGQNVLVLEAGLIDLQRYVEQNGAVRGKQLRQWAKSTAAVLACVHRAGLIWCDLSLKNLVLMPGSEGSVKAIDLESAVRKGGIPVDVSPPVTPPEAAAALRFGAQAVKVDEAFDAWAFGMSLLHLYTGQEYFASRGLRGPTAVLVELSREGFAVDVSAVADPAVRRLLEKLLSSEPKERIAALRSWYLTGL